MVGNFTSNITASPCSENWVNVMSMHAHKNISMMQTEIAVCKSLLFNTTICLPYSWESPSRVFLSHFWTLTIWHASTPQHLPYIFITTAYNSIFPVRAGTVYLSIVSPGLAQCLVHRWQSKSYCINHYHNTDKSFHSQSTHLAVVYLQLYCKFSQARPPNPRQLPITSQHMILFHLSE